MYVDCSCGHGHWGTYGAAGLLLTDPDRTGVVLQHRSAAVHQGDTWSVMGGALEPGESPVDAALREAHEEARLDPDRLTVLGTVVGMQHPEWTYTYVVAETVRPEHPELSHPATWEAERTAWVDLAEVAYLDLHPYFRQAWPVLLDLLRQDDPALQGSESVRTRGREPSGPPTGH